MKKVLATVLVGTMAASMLAGCGSSSSSSTASSTASDTAASEAAAAEESAPAEEAAEETTEAAADDAAASGEAVTLSVLDSMAYATDEYQEVIDQFEEDHPGVTVEIQHTPNDGTTIMQSRFNSGDIPDVFLNEPGTGAANYYEYAYDWSSDTDILAEFNDDAVALATDEEGHVYGLPWDYETMSITYNVDAFDKAGITELPVTMDELAEDCQKLQDAGVQPFYIDGQDGWCLGQMATHFIMDKSLDATGTVEALKSGELTFADLPNWQNFFKLLDLIKQYDSNKVLENGWEAAENAIANGEGAMLHMGDWAQANYTKMNPDCNLAFLPMPVGEGEDDCTILSSVGWIYMVYKDSPNLDLAKEFCEYVLTSDKGCEWITGALDAVPCSNTHTDMAPTGDLPKSSQEYINAGKTNGWIHTIAGTGYSDAVGPYIQGYLIDSYSADEVTQAFQDYFDTLE